MANKNAKYIRPVSELASLHSAHTEITITAKKNQQNFDFIYKMIPKDGRLTHTRVMDSNNKVHFFEGPVPDTIRPHRVNIKDIKTITIPVSVETEQGEDLLNFFLENPYCDVVNYKNDYLLNDIYRVEIRSLVIQGNYKAIANKMRYAESIMALDADTTNRLIYFLGGEGFKKTTAEKKIELIGTTFNGLALAEEENMKKLDRFLNSESDAIHAESLVKEAIVNKLILTGEDGYTTESGQYLGAKESDVVTFYEGRPNMLTKLQSEIYALTKQGEMANIYDDEDQLKKSLFGKHDEISSQEDKPKRGRRSAALEA